MPALVEQVPSVYAHSEPKPSIELYKKSCPKLVFYLFLAPSEKFVNSFVVFSAYIILTCRSIMYYLKKKSYLARIRHARRQVRLGPAQSWASQTGTEI